jgi:hypothetical protein
LCRVQALRAKGAHPREQNAGVDVRRHSIHPPHPFIRKLQVRRTDCCRIVRRKVEEQLRSSRSAVIDPIPPQQTQQTFHRRTNLLQSTSARLHAQDAEDSAAAKKGGTKQKTSKSDEEVEVARKRRQVDRYEPATDVMNDLDRKNETRSIYSSPGQVKEDEHSKCQRSEYCSNADRHRGNCNRKLAPV